MCTLNLLINDRHAWAWQDDVDSPMWSLNIAYVRRQKRRWRMIRNLVYAYDQMIAGHHEGEQIEHVNISAEDARFFDLDYTHTVVDEKTMAHARDAFTGHLYRIHTPFLSCPEVNWSANPSEDAPNHIYVDASFFPDGLDGVPVAAYALREDQQVETYSLSTAMTSVEAEMQALQHAIMRAHHSAAKTGQRYIVFSDCSAALAKIVLRKEMKASHLLGETVFVQWTPGHHRAVPGIIEVDRAARTRVRAEAAD